MFEELPQLPSTEELFEDSPNGALVLAPSGLILRVNRTFCTWVGLSANDLVRRKKLQELFTMGGRIFHQTHWLPMLEMQGSLSEVKFDLRRSDGRTFPVLLNAIRRHTEHGSLDMISVVGAGERTQYEQQLLAARKRADELLQKERVAQAALRVSQARLHQAMQLGAIVVWDVDCETGRRRFGDEVALLLGFGERRPVDQDLFLGAMAPEDRAAELTALAQALLSKEPYRFTYRLNGHDGVQRIVVSSAQGFGNEAGKLVEFVGTLVDVTESHRLRESAEDRALFAEQMVGIVSHDLRNPLHAISLSTQLLSRTGLDDTDRSTRMLGNMGHAAKRAERLIADLLDFTAARVGHGLAVKRLPVNIHEVVARALEELSLAFPDSVLEHRKIGDGKARADADRIVQLIGNLVGNAVTYGESGRPITVKSAVSDHGVALSVHNYGPPISAEKQASIFEPMVRGGEIDNSTRSVGLGLFIVQAIARAHGGQVEVFSQQSTGTEFVFRSGP